MKKRSVIALLLLVVMIFGVACSSNKAPEGDKVEETNEHYKLKFGGITSQDHAVGQIVNKYFDLVEERTDGRVEIQRLFDGSLGSAREIAESVKNGTIDFMWGGSGDLTVYAPVAEILTNAPYLYKTPQHGERVLKEVWPDVDSMIMATGFKPLFPAYTGTRQIISKKPVESFADMKGLKKRTVETPYFMGMFKAMNADPTSISFNEVYTSLQTGVVEAAGGDVLTIYTKKWHEQAKNLTLSNTILVQGILAMSEKSFSELPEDIQKIMVDTAWEVVPWANELTMKAEEETLEKLKSEGVNVIELNDEEIMKFTDSVSDFVGEFADDISPEARELYEKMKAID